MFLGCDDLEGTAQPQLVAARIAGFFDVVGHRLVQVRRVREVQLRIDGHRRPFDAAIGARQHPRAFLGRQHPHVLLRDHRFAKADQLAGRAVVHVDVARLAAVDCDLAHLAVLAGGLGQDHRRHRVEVPDVVRDVLVMALVGALVEVDGDDRVGVQVVARALGAVQVGARIADNEEDRVRFLVDRRRHPHTAA